MLLSPVHLSLTSDWGLAASTVWRSRPFTALNSAVFAPMPIASESSTTTVQALV